MTRPDGGFDDAGWWHESSVEQFPSLRFCRVIGLQVGYAGGEPLWILVSWGAEFMVEAG